MLIRECQCSPDRLLSLAAERPTEFPVFLHSAAEGPLSRWTILAAFPTQRLLLWGDGRLQRDDGVASQSGGFLAALASAMAIPDIELPVAEDLQLPFRGGWFVYLGYEIAAEIEPTLSLPRGGAGDLAACALRVPAALLWDAQTARGYALTESDDASQIEQLMAAVARMPPMAAAPLPALRLTEESPEQFAAMVQRAQEHIRRGDIYQANLSRRWHSPWPEGGSAAALYSALRAANPAPFAAWARLPGLEILSSSPERLVSVRDGMAQTRPIAGTRPRSGADGGAAEIAAMLASAKERAEHVMLIDLERSDLGRVCQSGSVEVSEYMVTESYAHVHHIVSNVRGRLRPDAGPIAVLRALFPGGTITGCPKVRCMQIIAELEQSPRGAYTGSLGYINRDGSMDMNILIRSFTLANGMLQFRAGAGIVADSHWRQELAETRAKARGLLHALGIAR